MLPQYQFLRNFSPRKEHLLRAPVANPEMRKPQPLFVSWRLDTVLQGT